MAKLANSSFALDFLRRLLCAHTTGGSAGHADIAHRSDGAASAYRCPTQEPGAEARSPCIVARLMGLDTMPMDSQARGQPPLRRSRSASSAEGCAPPPPPTCFGDAPQPRVIRTTSAPFREKPTYLTRESDEFLLLSFSPEDRGGDDEAEFLRASRSDEEEEEFVGRCGKRRVLAKKQRRRRRRPQRRYGEEEAGAECGMQNSSPVSVLDGQEEESTTTTSSSLDEVDQAEPCSPSSVAGFQPAPRRQQQQLQPGSRRKLQHDFDDFDGGQSPATASTCNVSECSDTERRNRRVVKKAAQVITPDASVTSVCQLICRLVEEDTNGGMKWEARNDTSIAAEMESEILDKLICVATDELMQLIKF